MNGALLTALERIEREKGISKEILFEAIESALVSAARKVIDDPDIAKEDISVTMDQETGEIKVFSEGEEVQSERFGRIAAQTAKQVIIQKIREAERDVIFDKYFKKVGSIISGSVHRFEKGKMIVELDDAEAVLPKQGQIPRERFRQGELIRAYLVDVDRGASGPELILSRTDAGFVKKLFELEVPEITEGIVEIKGVAREAGERTKIAVVSKEEKIDAVGACVGMRGSRVRDIVKELNGERIDIVRWHDDIREYLKAAVNPAEITKMVVDRENESITLTVPKDQLSLLIGKNGRNIRLASKLLGWELQAEAERDFFDIPLSEVKGVGEKTRSVLEDLGYANAESVLEIGVDGLLELDGIGEKTAQKIVDACEEVYQSKLQEKQRLELEAAAAAEEAAAEEQSADDGQQTTEAQADEAEAEGESSEGEAEQEEATGEEKEIAEEADEKVEEEVEAAEEQTTDDGQQTTEEEETEEEPSGEEEAAGDEAEDENNTPEGDQDKE